MTLDPSSKARKSSPDNGSLRVLLVCEDIPGAALGGLARHVVALGNALLDAGHAVALMGRHLPRGLAAAEPSGFRGPFINGFANPFQGWKEHATGMFNPWKRPHYAAMIASAITDHAHQFDVVHYHGHHPMVARYVPESVNFLQTRHDQGSECITHIRFRGGEVCNELLPQACAGCVHAMPGRLRTAVSAAAVERYRQETAEAFARHPVIFVSGFLLDNYRRVAPSAPLLAHVVHNFVDEGALRAAASAAAGALETGARRDFNVHVAGRVEPAKGIAAFVEQLLPRMPAHWRIQLYGDGPERARLQSVRDNRVVMHGHRPLEAVLTGAATANVVVVPSLLEEAFGLVTLEALRLGLPCYALRRGGTPELARYGADGQLRLFEDLPTLVDGLLQGASGPVLPGGESADVRARLPELLALYRMRAGDS